MDHIVGIAIRKKLIDVPIEAKNVPADFCPKTKPVSGTLSGFKHAILKRLYYLKLKEQSFIGERWEMVALHTERHILFRMKDLINTFGKTLKVLETDATLQLSTLEDVKNSCIFELLLTLQGVQTSSIFKSLLLAFMLCFHKYNMIEFYDRYLRYELKVVFNPPVGVNIYTPTNRRIQVEGSMNALVRAHTPSSVVLGCRSPVLLSTNILLCDIRIRTAFGLEGSFLHNLNHPWGLCVDKDGKIFIPDRRNNCIKIFDNSGHFLNVLQIKIIEQGVERELTLKKPAGIATDGVRVYISDKDNHRVVIYNLVDEETTILGGVPGNAFGDEIFIGENAEMETGEFDFPWGIAVNREGHILVADSKHHKIHLFDRDHMLINEYIIEPPEADARYGAKIAKPRGVCFTPSGEILVTDFEYHRILKFDNELKLQKSIGYPGQFDRPSGICCDDNGFIVVADSKNQRILIYDSRFEYVNK
ncbi:Protein wech, partial [Pseudolycoriella hygida]